MYGNAVELAKSEIVNSIYKSACLEGLNLTQSQVGMILSNNFLQIDVYSIAFVRNMNMAWSFLLENINYPCNLLFIRELNRIVGYELFYSCGSIRTFPVSISGTSYVPPIPFESEIIENLNYINAEESVVLRALKLFCYVARTQMFEDGNKRIAQLVANKVLIENNVGIFQIPENRLKRFISLLVDFYETNNDSKLVKFMLDYCIVRR